MRAVVVRGLHSAPAFKPAVECGWPSALASTYRGLPLHRRHPTDAVVAQRCRRMESSTPPQTDGQGYAWMLGSKAIGAAGRRVESSCAHWRPEAHGVRQRPTLATRDDLLRDALLAAPGWWSRAGRARWHGISTDMVMSPPMYAGRARLAVSLVLKVEEGAELESSAGDERNKTVYETVQPVEGAPDLCLESLFEYGACVGIAPRLTPSSHPSTLAPLPGSGVLVP
jgi:hypothetical protein